MKIISHAKKKKKQTRNFLKIMELHYIYLKSADLDGENKFNIQLTKGIEVKEVKISKNSNYLLTNLKIAPKLEEDVTQWNDYEKFSNFVKEKKKCRTRSLKLKLDLIF